MNSAIKFTPVSLVILWFCKVIGAISRVAGLGSGSTWPGEIALSLDRNFTKRLIQRNSHLKIVFVVGTNGKTTTVKLLSHIAAKTNHRVFSNTSGANLFNGITSSLIGHANFSGRMNFDTAVFELDENAFSQVALAINPSVVIGLNLFRDQLDRYGEIDTIVDRWHKTIDGLPSEATVWLNGQDPNLFFLGKYSRHSQIKYFGLVMKDSEGGLPELDADILHCPHCQSPLKFSKIAYSHLGDFTCPKCGGNVGQYQTAPIEPSPLVGRFNGYNLTAALLIAQQLWKVSPATALSLVQDFSAAFGRQEVIQYQKRNFLLQLSKNPVGFNQSISIIAAQQPVMILLNDNIPDGRDVSWIWDVNFEQLVKKSGPIFVGGNRAEDLALRLEYASDYEHRPTVVVDDSLPNLISGVISQTPEHQTITVLPVYSAMLEVRKILTGSAIRKEANA